MNAGDLMSLRLRQAQTRMRALPDELEQIARAQVLNGVPPTTSVLVGRTGTGVRVLVSGPGAIRHARALRAPLRNAVRAAVQKAIRP